MIVEPSYRGFGIVNSMGKPGHSPPPRVLALGGLLAMATAIGVGRFIYTPILPLMIADLGMTASAAGLVASANFAGYLAGALLAAAPVMRGSRRRYLLAGLILGGLTTGAMAFPSSLTAFIALRFVGGVASAVGLVFASALVLDRIAAHHPELSAVHFAGVGVGIAVAALVASMLAPFGWRSIWLAGGAVSLIATAVVARLIPEASEETRKQIGQPNRFPPRLATFAAAYGLFGFGYIILATFVVAIVRASSEVRALESVVWLVVGLTAAPSVAVWTRVAARLGFAGAFGLACIVEAIGVVAAILPTIAAVLLGAALLGGTFMGLTALGLVGARRRAPGDPRTTLAVMTAAFGLGQIIGPAFAGFVHDLTGSFVGSSLVAAGALLVGALLAFASRDSTA